MKTRISINVLTACVALLAVAVGYIIFSGNEKAPSAALKEIDGLKVQNVRMAKELKELKSLLEGEGGAVSVAEQPNEKPRVDERGQPRGPLEQEKRIS